MQIIAHEPARLNGIYTDNNANIKDLDLKIFHLIPDAVQYLKARLLLRASGPEPSRDFQGTSQKVSGSKNKPDCQYQYLKIFETLDTDAKTSILSMIGLKLFMYIMWTPCAWPPLLIQNEGSSQESREQTANTAKHQEITHPEK